MTTARLRRRLEAADLDAVLSGTLDAAARALAGHIGTALGDPPWVGVRRDGADVIIGVVGAAARDREFGTASAPPEGRLRAAASGWAERAAGELGDAAVTALRDATRREAGGFG